MKKSKKKRETISEELVIIANNILSKYNKKISKKNINLSLYNEGYFDSLDFVNFISKVEKKFKFKFKTSDLNVNLTIKKILSLIDYKFK